MRQLPRFSIMALDLLAAPTMSDEAERIFSMLGNIEQPNKAEILLLLLLLLFNFKLHPSLWLMAAMFIMWYVNLITVNDLALTPHPSQIEQGNKSC